MDLKTALINRLREAEAAARKAVEKYNATIKRYGLSQEGRSAEQRAIYNETALLCEAAREKGLADIDEKIAELNRREQEAALSRSLDTDYLQRLNEKINLLQSMNLKETDPETLRNLLAEYENDPVAAAVLTPIFPEALGASNFLPKDNTGKRQDHLEKIVKPGFVDAINRACLSSPEDLATRAIYNAGSALEGFIQYVQHQNEDFSRDDMEVWKEIRDEGNPYKAEPKEESKFNFHFRNVHTGKYN